MNQPLPPDDTDQLLRDALRAEAEGIEAPHDLFERITTDVATARRPIGRWLAVAAAAAVVVGVAASVLLSDDEEPVDTISGPSTTLPTTTPSSTATTLPTPGGDRPTEVALVREDGMLMVIDLMTGEQRELYTRGNPADDSPAGGPDFIDSAEISPDGDWVYFSTCCEPAGGTTYRIPTAGGKANGLGPGANSRVSPDGRHVATSGCQFVFVLTADGQVAANLEVDECVGSLAWSPDGRQLAATTATAPGVTPQMLLFDWDGSSLTRADPGKPDNSASFVAWAPDGMLHSMLGGPVEDDRTVSQDASFHWILWVDEAGVVREQAGFESGDRVPIEGLPEALAADW